MAHYMICYSLSLQKLKFSNFVMLYPLYNSLFNNFVNNLESVKATKGLWINAQCSPFFFILVKINVFSQFCIPYW